MRLKSLDIKGFKSFADKTHVELDNAITGIVGPNGCGKSNIVDAIRWVIGEHKIKSLRSDSLDDLIFNGSKSRRASAMAEVSLTFENTKNLLPTDFTTVTITRKFYKNGESEYRLNDVACRLKDITNLFLDTGVSNDSYAIIELGMVDDIIKDKDGSRRKMLEQAAGISIYKARKKEAKNKLDGTENDISRIEDLLFEISNNLRTLESQARKAERYFKIKEAYKDVSIELAKVSLGEFNDKYQELNQQYEQIENSRIKINTEIAGDEAQIEENKVKLIQMEQGLHVAQKEFNELVNRIRGLENEKKLAAQRLDHLKDRKSSITNFLKNAATQEQTIEENISGIEKQLSEWEEKITDIEGKFEIIADTLEEKKDLYEQRKQELEQERNLFFQTQKDHFEAEKSKAIVDTKMANLVRAQSQAMEELERRRSQLENTSHEWKKSEADKTTLEQEVKTLEEDRAQTEDKILKHQEQVEKLREQLAEENRNRDAKKNEYDLLESLVQSWEGFPESIKYLSQSEDWHQKSPLVSDILVVQDEYKRALEHVLESYLNYYVVDDVQAAKSAIALLRSNNKGKANFFILDQIQSPPRAAQAKPSWKAALDIVTVDKKYQPIADWLLANVYITDSNEYTDQMPEGIVLVQQEGSFIQQQYTIGGGSVGLFEGNKIGRVKNLEKLEEEINIATERTENLKESMQVLLKDISGWEQELSVSNLKNKQEELNRQSNLEIQLKNKMEHIQTDIEADEQKITAVRQQIEEIENSNTGQDVSLSDLNLRLQEFEQKIKLIQQDFAVSEQDFQMAQQQYNLYQLDINKAKSGKENQEQQLVFRKNQLEELKNQINTNQQQLTETNDLITETTGKLDFGDDEIHELLSKKEADEKALNVQDQEYYKFRNEVVEHEKSISRQRKEKENAETLMQEINEKLTNMKLQTAGLKERLSVEFKVDLETVLEEERQTEKSLDELHEEVDKLKKRLDNMGEINPTAVEAYQEMKVRSDFIIDQKQDLEKAKNALIATIEEVEKTANEKFKETFDQVRENFITVFKALFTEDDNADLKLTDEDNIAESGIEIYAQPKGKRPSTLTQLSGGEKTLTSTAFLFAIYLIKPAPFCILDEVDAPLDDANVGKFTSMIRQFSDNSQFIIITHNKQTMASVDVIYGVTMQEAGVSKLVPVDFRSLN